MKKQLMTSLLVAVLGLTLSACGESQEEFKTGGGGGSTKPQDPSEKLTSDRNDNTRLMLEQMSHAAETLSILATEPSQLPRPDDCVSYEFWPGDSPFLIAHYNDCDATAKVGGAVLKMRFTGKEEYAKDKSLTATGSFELTITNSKKQTTEKYALVREMRMALPTAKTGQVIVQFAQNHRMTRLDGKTEESDGWKSEIRGRSVVQFNQTGAGKVAEVKAILKQDLFWNLEYQTATWVSSIKKYRAVKGEMNLVPQVDFALRGTCALPVGRFSYSLTEAGKSYPTGQIETDENGMREPNSKDPAAQKPKPWEKCRNLPVLF